MYTLFTFHFVSDINYFHCLKIIEILKETEADTKNVFGRYGSQRMKDWLEIIRLYEKDNVYLAEVAQMLIRNVNYEIPSTKKQIQKLEQMRTVSVASLNVLFVAIFLRATQYLFNRTTRKRKRTIKSRRMQPDRSLIRSVNS